MPRVARAVATLLGGLIFAACGDAPFREVTADSERAPVASVASADVDEARRSRVEAHVLHVSVAGMESPRSTHMAYASLFAEVGRRLGQDVGFVQRRTYAEINELLATGGLDVALICTGGYLQLSRERPGAVEIVAVPVVEGSETYESLVIVPAASQARSIGDLAGKRFAFTDGLSLTGRAWVVHQLADMGQKPEGFFAGTVFTGSHDRSVTAVARGVVDGAAVHSVVYQRIVARDAQVGARTRVIATSPPFGVSPVVASTRLPGEVRERLRAVLTTLADDPDGAAMLRGAQIDRFAAPEPGLYDSAARVTAGSR